jgi:TonB family protein
MKVPDKHPSAPVREIEIVDAKGQHRTISLLHSFTERAHAASQTTTANDSTPPPANRGLDFQLWTLSPPRRSAASSEVNAIKSGAPPALEDKTGPALAAGIVEPIRPDALPRPDTITGHLKRGALIHRVEPTYPELARQQGVFGTVTLRATVDPQGAVREVRVISGPKMLIQSAVNAVRQWRYAPTMLDGKAIETEVEINLVFNLPNRG